MTMKKKKLNIFDIMALEQIVRLGGSCMDAARCRHCPIRSYCLLSFINTKIVSPEKRISIALDLLTHISVFGMDNFDLTEYKWDN